MTVESPDPAAQRASDAEREQVARRLYQAVSEGRLTMAEGDERLAALWETRTRGELAPLVADLPVTASPQPVAAPAGPSVDLAVLSEEQRAAILAQVPLGRYAAPAEVAAAVTWLAGPGGGCVTGAVIPVDGGLGMGH